MPSVAEELAALRGRGLTSKEAGKLKGKAPMSTPENVTKDLRDNKTNLKHVDAVKASTATNQETEWYLKQKEQKQADQGKKQEAAKILQGYKKGPTALPPVLPGTKTEAAPVAAKVATKVAATAVAPVAAPVAAKVTQKIATKSPAVESTEDDIPELDEIPDLDGVPDLKPVPAGVPASGGTGLAEEGKHNRAEKKARKALQKLGMRPVTGINRATFKMRSGIFAIDNPDVYQSGKSHVVFGQATQQDAGGQMAQAAKHFQQPAMQQQAATPLGSDDDLPEPVSDPEAVSVEGEAIDETGIDGKDVDLVMDQASCSRNKAVQALKENGGDLVNAIMALTT